MQEQINEFWQWPGWTSLAAIGALLAAIATIVYTRFTFQILSATRASIDRQNRVHEFEIFTKLSEELQTEKALQLGYACKTNTLKINLPLGEALTSQYTGDIPTTGSQLRQHLLNPLEKLAKFWKDGLVSIETIDITLGYFILDIGNCTQVVNHIHDLRQNVYNNDSLYDGLEALYTALYNQMGKAEQDKYPQNFSTV